MSVHVDIVTSNTGASVSVIDQKNPGKSMIIRPNLARKADAEIPVASDGNDITKGGLAFQTRKGMLSLRMDKSNALYGRWEYEEADHELYNGIAADERVLVEVQPDGGIDINRYDQIPA